MSKELTLAEVRTLANSTTRSGMFGLKNEEQAFVLMNIAQAEGIHPIQAVQKYSIINGMPSLKSHEIQARFQKSGGKISWLETSNKKAILELQHPAYNGSYKSEFSIEDATLMGLANKDNWKRMPKQMCMARAVSMGVRAVYPDCLNNMYSEEENRDIQIEEIEEVEIENEIVDNTKEHNINKSLLATKLKKDYGFNDAMVKEFAIENKLADDFEEVILLLEDAKVLFEKVEKFNK